MTAGIYLALNEGTFYTIICNDGPLREVGKCHFMQMMVDYKKPWHVPL